MRGKPKAVEAEKARFFDVSLVNANVMSVPKFPQPQRLMGELVHSIQAVNPTFAWVQFLFRRADYSRSLVALKNAMHYAQQEIKTPKRSIIDDSEYDRPELYRDWYKRSGERIKRIDSITHAPHVVLAIQGMWVGDPGHLSALPFGDCYDEHDRLGTFVYRDPRMLLELVERSMVNDISSYIASYARSRLEPPSFLITQEEVPYYLHLPVATSPDFLGSLGGGTPYSPDVPPGAVERKGAAEASPSTSIVLATPAADVRVLRLSKVPRITEPLKDDQAERLALLPRQSVRGFELLFESGATQLLLSARSGPDLDEYLGVMESVYGKLDVTETQALPYFLRQVPRLVGLV